MNYQTTPYRLKRNAVRNSRGNILLLGSLLIIVLTLAVVGVVNTGLLASVYENDSASVEAAALAAASDVSRIVMNDQRYGYVSLSPHRATGKATFAADGLATEVTGINSIIAAARLENLVSHDLQTDELIALSERESVLQRETVIALNHYLQSSLDTTSTKFIDADGAVVSPYNHAKDILSKNLQERLKGSKQSYEIKNLRLSLGWSQIPMTSGVSVPGDAKSAELKPDTTTMGKYRAFCNIPANGTPFYFAAISPSVSTVESQSFRLANDQCPGSVVKVECDIRIHNAGDVSKESIFNMIFPRGFVHHVACARAAGYEPSRSVDVLTVNFEEQTPGIASLVDFLKARSVQGRDTNITTSQHGDLGADATAFIANSTICDSQHPSPSQIFADAIHSWLRHVGARVKLNSLIDVMNEPFSSAVSSSKMMHTFTYEVAANGIAQVRGREQEPFPANIRAENQTCGYCPFTSPEVGSFSVALVRNHCSHLGTINGGKHAGQPMDAVAVNWRELEYFSGSDQLARSAGVGELANHLTVHGIRASSADGTSIPYSVSPGSATFYTASGEKVKGSPRGSFYCGGEVASITVLQKLGRNGLVQMHL